MTPAHKPAMNTPRLATGPTPAPLGQPLRLPSLRRLSWGAAACLAALVSVPARASDASAAPTVAAWTPASLRSTLADLPRGDPAAGQRVHEQLFCASCHGDKGVAPTQNWPHLAGQRAAYTAKMLLDYQDKRRLEGKRAELMHDIAVMMTPQHIADVAAFYAAQPAPQADGTPRPKPERQPNDVAAETLVRFGDKSRLITPCASCHGVAGQGGKLEASALAGQNPLYFVRTLLDYQSGVRHNDSVKGMRASAKKLSRSEIEALATYYADLPGNHSAVTSR
ncbi:MAG: c-type cytochrome [Burkholderiaceae bacterium]|nr:c-type cytochrome [Burkholderiaceae bacterium]